MRIFAPPLRPIVVAAEHSYPVPAGDRPGILTGLGDYGHSALLRSFEVTPTTPPSDQVHVAAGQLVHRVHLVGLVAADIQLDGVGEPLAPGESYLALLTAGPTGITATKSFRAPVPTRPSAPPWERVLAVLEVLAVLPEATPEVNATQITDLRVFDRYHAEPGEHCSGQSPRSSCLQLYLYLGIVQILLVSPGPAWTPNFWRTALRERRVIYLAQVPPYAST